MLHMAGHLRVVKDKIFVFKVKYVNSRGIFEIKIILENLVFSPINRDGEVVCGPLVSFQNSSSLSTFPL